MLFWSAVACGSGGLWDPEGLFRSQYQGWGQQLQQHRDEDFVWKDGSGWLDGVSNTPPQLPLPPGTLVGAYLTCAQEEIVSMMAFPTFQDPDELHVLPNAEEINRQWKTEFFKSEDPDEWYLLPDAEEINRQWKTEFSRMVWGDHTQALTWLAREPFAERCGLASHFRLFDTRF